MVVPKATATAKAVITQDTIANTKRAVHFELFLSEVSDSSVVEETLVGHSQPSLGDS